MASLPEQWHLYGASGAIPGGAGDSRPGNELNESAVSAAPGALEAASGDSISLPYPGAAGISMPSYTSSGNASECGVGWDPSSGGYALPNGGVLAQDYSLVQVSWKEWLFRVGIGIGRNGTEIVSNYSKKDTSDTVRHTLWAEHAFFSSQRGMNSAYKMEFLAISKFLYLRNIRNRIYIKSRTPFSC